MWKSYCQSLFNDTQSNNFPNAELELENLEPDTLKFEVRAAIMHYKNGKATGRDAIPIEAFRALDDIRVNIFHNISNKI